MTSAMRAIGHRLMQPGSFLSGGARTDVTAPAGATLPACFEHLVKALEALASKTSDAWLGVNA